MHGRGDVPRGRRANIPTHSMSTERQMCQQNGSCVKAGVMNAVNCGKNRVQRGNCTAKIVVRRRYRDTGLGKMVGLGRARQAGRRGQRPTSTRPGEGDGRVGQLYKRRSVRMCARFGCRYAGEAQRGGGGQWSPPVVARNPSRHQPPSPRAHCRRAAVDAAYAVVAPKVWCWWRDFALARDPLPAPHPSLFPSPLPLPSAVHGR